MKKTLTTLALFILLILLFAIPVSADSGAEGRVAALSMESYPIKTVYGAFEHFDAEGMRIYAIYEDGNRRQIDNNELEIKYHHDTCFRVGDQSVRIGYGGKSIDLPVTVNRVAYDLSALNLEDFSVVYNGKYQSYSNMPSPIVGKDGIPLIMTAIGGSVNAGEYDVSIDFHTESLDYLTPESIVVRMTIEPYAAEIIWSDLSPTYDGKSKSPIAYYLDVNGERVYPKVSGAATNVGTGYLARAIVYDPNYVFSGQTANFEIQKATYDLSRVVWSCDSFVYDGSKKSISASGLPAGVSVVSYNGDIATDAGRYTVSANLSWDRTNYNSPDPLTHSWEILPAEYDMRGVEFKPNVGVYDGGMHYPTLVGKMPVGADGISLEYSFSAGACHVSDGTVSVIISFSTKSKNYNIPENRYSNVSVTPRGIQILWGKTELSYTGEPIAPTAQSDACVVNVVGRFCDVGFYTAGAETENTDYYIINDSIEFSIIKASNAWISQPASSVCYEGREIVLTGTPKFGSPKYTFYSDPEGTNTISPPTLPGKYYAVISIAETENYSGLTSSIIEFEIEKILPVAFVGELLGGGFTAFERLGADDILCKVINNDGSTAVIDSALVTVVYQNGDSLRRRDELVTLKYEGFTLALKIKVDYASYDLSSAVWKNTSQSYDGSAKTPILTGLPEGVSVAEYVGGAQINAGTYKISVRLNYDSDNYNEPIIAPCDFLIEKCRINVPRLSAVYNGELQGALSDSPLYSVTSGQKYVKAGKYTVSLTLLDPENYVFAESMSGSANAVFEIVPATLGVSVSDLRLRLFEKMSNVDYKIISGSLYGNDSIRVTPYVEGKNVYVRSENPNYTLDVTPGRLIRLPYPTASGGLKLFIAFTLAALVVFSGIKMYSKREKIATAVAMMKCKWQNRDFKADSPRTMEKTTGRADDIFFEEDDEPDVPPILENNEEEEKTIPTDEDILEELGQDLLGMEVDSDRADILITDSLAKSLLVKRGEVVFTDGREEGMISIGMISDNFSAGDRVDVNILKSRGLISADTSYLIILSGGRIDKPLNVYANEFSLSAIKMIALTGGQAIKVTTQKQK